MALKIHGYPARAALEKCVLNCDDHCTVVVVIRVRIFDLKLPVFYHFLMLWTQKREKRESDKKRKNDKNAKTTKMQKREKRKYEKNAIRQQREKTQKREKREKTQK